MIALVTAVFLASLLGSVHCAGMCGAFAACAVAPSRHASSNRLRAQVAYNLGRLVTYTMLGTLAGALGAVLDLGAAWVGIQRAAMLLAGAMMLGFGVVAIARQRGVRLPHFRTRYVALRIVRGGFESAAAMPPTRRAATIGLLTTLLPCGWLYAFAIAAAGTGSPLRGAATMAAFWLGTLPMMAAIGVGVQALAPALARRAPAISAWALIAVGAYTLAGRLVVPPIAFNHPADAATVDHVQRLDPDDAACCHGGTPEVEP